MFNYPLMKMSVVKSFKDEVPLKHELKNMFLNLRPVKDFKTKLLIRVSNCTSGTQTREN